MYRELALWRAVVRQAIDDLFGGSKLERRAAFRWLFENNSDYRKVCDLAGVNPMCVRKSVFKKIINGD